MNKNKMAIGNVEKEMKFGFVSFGENRWRWKRRYFSEFKIEPHLWINPHMIIIGGSGGGKSNACKTIVNSLCSQGAHVAILDPHNEYLGLSGVIDANVYDASRNGVNMFDLDGMTEKERASEITGMLKRNFRLGEVQGYTLYRCIMYAYGVLSNEGKVPNIHNLMFAIKAFKKNSNTASEKTVLESLERRISLIDTGAFEKNADMSKVICNNSVFLLSKLHTPESQSIYIEGFLRKIYSKMLSLEKTDRPRLYVVIDEAEKLGDNPIIGKIAAEGRKYGIGIIAISQRAKLIDKDLRGNAAVLISFGIKEPEELNYVANFISGGNESGRFAEVKRVLRNISRGNAVVIGTHIRNPIIVRFNRCEIDSQNLRYRVAELSRDGIKRDELFHALHNVGNLEETIRNMMLNEELKQCDMICGKYSGNWYISNSHNSAEHDIAVGIISKHLLSIGVKNRIYNSTYGPDIVVFLNRRRLAIEYETGSKKIESSIKMVESRNSRYDKTITIVNDNVMGSYHERLSGVIPFSHIEGKELEAMLSD